MFAKILKANPYHDKSGRFTSKDKGATATLGLNDFRAALGMRASIPASRVSVGGEDMYAFTNGKRPSGKGSWMFSPKRSINFDTDKAGKDFFSVPLRYQVF